MKAFPVLLIFALTNVIPASRAQAPNSARQLEPSSDPTSTRTELARAAANSPNSIPALTAYAEYLDRYDDPRSREAYRKLLTVLRKSNDSARSSAIAGRLAALDLLAGDRAAATQDLEGMQTKSGKSANLGNGAPAPGNSRMRCMTPAEVSDLGKTFSPEANAVGAACERAEHELTATSLKWRLTCTGQVSMEVAGAFAFETPQRYTAEVRSQMTMAGQTMASRVKIEGERVGECP